MTIEFANTFSEKTFFFTPVIAYNNDDKELLISFICFAILVTFNKVRIEDERVEIIEKWKEQL